MATKRSARQRGARGSGRNRAAIRIAPQTPTLRERVFRLTRLIDRPLDLYHHLPFRLATVANLLALDRDIAVRRISFLGLRELRVLLNIGSYMPIRVSDVAYQTRLDTYTVSRAAKTLHQRRLIELSPDPSDRRVQYARLTASGVQQYRRVVEVIERRGEVLESVLTGVEIENLYGALARLEEKAESLLAAHAVEALERGQRIAADQRELIRWRKRSTSHGSGSPTEDASTA